MPKDRRYGSRKTTTVEGKTEYQKEYMRKRRQKQNAVIEEMTDSTYEAMTTRWCIETRMKGGDSREEAEEWCRVNTDAGVSVDASVIFPSVALDDDPEATPLERCIQNRMETKGVSEEEALEWCKANIEGITGEDAGVKLTKRLFKKRFVSTEGLLQNPDEPCVVCHTVGSVNLWIDSDRSRRTVCGVCGVLKDATPAALDGLGIVDREATEYQRCVSLRMDVLGENEVVARTSCDHLMADPMFQHLWKEEIKRNKKWDTIATEISNRWVNDREMRSRRDIGVECVREYLPNLDVFSELGERVYITKKMYGIHQDQARKFVEDEMMREYKLADVNVPKAPGESVGNLYGKSREQRIKENTTSKDTRLTVGSLYMKKKDKKGGYKENGY